MTKKGIAMVEMKNSRGADNVLNHLNRAKVLGSQISVSNKSTEYATIGFFRHGSI